MLLWGNNCKWIKYKHVINTVPISMPIDEIQINRLFLSGVKLAQYVLYTIAMVYSNKKNRTCKSKRSIEIEKIHKSGYWWEMALCIYFTQYVKYTTCTCTQLHNSQTFFARRASLRNSYCNYLAIYLVILTVSFLYLFKSYYCKIKLIHSPMHVLRKQPLFSV